MNRIINDDFKASEDDRRQKNECNWQINRLYHTRDLLTSEALRIPRENNNLGARTGYSDIDGEIPSNAYIPWLRGVALTALAMTANAVWPDYNKFFRFKPNHRNDERPTEAAYEVLMWFLRQSGYHREALLTILQAIKYDFGILYTGWRRDFGWVPTRVKNPEVIRDYLTGQYVPTGNFEEEYQSYEYKLGAVDVPDIYSVSTYNFRYDPQADHRGFDGCWWAGMTYPLSKMRMWEIAESGLWDKDEIAKISDDEPINDDDHDDEADGYAEKLKKDEKLAGSESDEYYQKNFVRVKQYHMKNAVVWQLNGKIIPRKPLKTIGWPFRKVVWVPNEGMFSGTSLCEPLAPVQVDINQMLRLMRTQQDRAVNPDLLVDATMFDSLAEVKAIPFGTGTNVYITKNPQNKPVSAAVGHVIYPSNTAPDMANATAVQVNAAEQQAGISQNAQTGQAQYVSATQSMQVAAAVNSRSALTQKEIENELVGGFIDRLLKLIHLNVRKPLIIRIKGAQGNEFRNIVPADLIFERSPDVVPLGMSSLMAKQSGFQVLRDAVVMFSSNPMFSQFLRVVPAMQELLRMLDVDPDQFINDENLAAFAKMPQGHENILMAAGIVVPINPADNDQEHIDELNAFVADEERISLVPEANHHLLTEHLELHLAALKAKANPTPGMPSLAAPAAPGGPPPGPQSMQGPTNFGTSAQQPAPGMSIQQEAA